MFAGGQGPRPLAAAILAVVALAQDPALGIVLPTSYPVGSLPSCDVATCPPPGGTPQAALLPATLLPATLLPATLPRGTPDPIDITADTGGGPAQAGSTVLFVGDYDTGDFAQWTTVQNRVVNSSAARYPGNFYGLTLTTQGQREGTHAARFEVRDGDVPEFGGGERSELSSSADGALTHEGDERWYQWSMRFPATFTNPTGGWFIVMQWQGGSGSPPVAINVSGRGDVEIDSLDDGTRTIGPVRRGQWVDYTLHVKFSRDRSTGFVEAWENGVLTVPRTAQATMSSNENYLKQGIYRDAGDSGTAVVFHDGLRVTGP